MKGSNFVELKINENNKREKKSPIRTLLKLTVNPKRKNKISVEKRKIQPVININNNYNNYNNKLSKVSSARNVYQNYQNLNLLVKNKKQIENNNIENINYSNNTNNLLLKKLGNYNYFVKNNKNIKVNCANNYNNYNKKKNEQNMNKNKNIKQKKLKIEHNDDNNIRKPQKNIMTYNIYKNNKIKSIYINKNIEKKNKEIKQINNNINNNIELEPNDNDNNISFFNSKFEISNKKEEKNENFQPKGNNNKNKNIKINNRNNNEFEKPNTNRNSSCINFYNKYLKNNFTKRINNQKNEYPSSINNSNKNIINYKNITNDSNKGINHPFSTINNDEFYLNRFNLINKKNMQNNQNKKLIVNIKNENISTINNILINNNKQDPNNLVYSSKKVIYRVHSQENVQSKKMNDSNHTKENSIIYKNKSVKDLSNYTYSKKKYLYKQGKNDEYIEKCGIIDISDSTPIKKNKNNINEKIYNIKTVMNKEDIGYINNEYHQMKPDIYPEIKINLRKNRYKKMKNNSVIVENHNRYNINGSIEDNIEEENYPKKRFSIYNNYKKNNELSNKKKENDNYITNINNSNKNISNFSYLSNINKSNIYTNSNISYITIPDSNFNTCLSNGDLKNKNLKTNLNDRIISINDLYYIFIYEEKIRDIFNSVLKEDINNISNYCFELINFFYNYSINKYIHNIIVDKIDLKNLNICNNYTLFSIILFYELSFNKNYFKSVQILIKELLKIIYSNLILVIRQSNNILKNLELQEKNNVSELYDIINNILNKYINNKELYIDENECILLNQKNSNLSYEEKIFYNLNFIIRNIHTIINNISEIDNFKHFLNIINLLNNISTEEIIIFFRAKILRVNTFNSSLLSSIVLEKNFQNKKKRVISPYITNSNKKKYTLILSLDETIIHFKESTFINNKGIVQIRPGLIEFLQNISNYYEIIIFSCGNKQYSDAIIDSIDEKNKYIDYRLYQEHCIIINDDFVKDISKIGRPLDKIIIVDNIAQNYRLQKDNGINIKSFYGDNSNDKILFYLSKILIKIAHDGGDIRKGIKNYWKEIIYKISSNIFNNYCK